ncbi:MAG: hypothetical protein ACYCST_09905 [Acidimicrobiales bacterium]
METGLVDHDGTGDWVVQARHLETGVVDHDGTGIRVVQARHLGEHLALMPVPEPAPAPHLVAGATGPRRRRIAEIHARHAVDLDAAEALFGIDLSAPERGR